MCLHTINIFVWEKLYSAIFVVVVVGSLCVCKYFDSGKKKMNIVLSLGGGGGWVQGEFANLREQNI